MSRRKYRARFTANPGPMPPDVPPPVPPPPSPPDAAQMAQGGEPDETRSALARRIAELQQAEQLQQAQAAQMQAQAAMQATGDPIDRLPASPALKEWLKQHREALGDQRKLLRLQAAHLNAQADEVPADSDEYFARLAHAIGHAPVHHHAHESAPMLPTNGETTMAHTPPPAMPRLPYAAPVSRSGGAGSGPVSGNRVVLSPAEREAARLSGVSESEYAAHKLQLARKRATGEYSEQR